MPCAGSSAPRLPGATTNHHTSLGQPGRALLGALPRRQPQRRDEEPGRQGREDQGDHGEQERLPGRLLPVQRGGLGDGAIEQQEEKDRGSRGPDREHETRDDVEPPDERPEPESPIWTTRHTPQ